MAYSISYLPQAEAVLSSLNSEERSRVFARVMQVEKSSLTGPTVKRLAGIYDREPAYVLDATDDLQVVFTAGHNRITVLDVFNRHFVQRYG